MKKTMIHQTISFIIITLFLFSTIIPERVYAQATWQEITSPTEFNEIRNNLSANYRLMTDINLSIYPSWNPIGTATTPFTGQLDGNGKVIRNLSITDTTTTNQGLFSVIGATGKIENLAIENANITAGDNSGILAGINYGEISTTSTAGIIAGSQNIGGFVGLNAGTITNSFSNADVSGNDQIGGLCGTNNGTIATSYSASKVSSALLNTYLEFDGVDDYISIPNRAYYLTDTFTLEAWFEWGKTDSSEVDFIVGKGVEQFEIHTGGGSGVNGIRFIPAQRTKNAYSDERAYQDTHNVIQSGWFHVASVWNFKEIRDVDGDSDLDRVYTAQIYINGVAQNIYQNQGGVSVNVGKIAEVQFEDPDTNPNEANGYDFYIGKRSDGTYPFKGKIRDVRFWNIPRTAEQIAADKHSQLNGTETGLIGYWKLDQIIDGKVQDSTTNSNDGTVYGATPVTSTPVNIGGLVGVNSGTVTDAYYDQQVSGQNDSSKGTPKTTLEMKTATTFSNWSLEAVWVLADGAYPAFIQYTLTYTAGDHGSLDGELSQTIRPGGYSSTVTANANEGYTFINWNDAVTTAARKDSLVSGNLSVEAQFADITAPMVINVTSDTADGAYSTAELIEIKVKFNEAVTVNGGSPQLILETGGTDRTINYTSGSETDTLTFRYTVQTGDTTADLDYLTTTSLALNGTTIRDAAGNDADLTLAETGSAASLAGSSTIVIDTSVPQTTISANPANPSNSSTSSFTFSGDDAGGSGVTVFDCQLDGGGYIACTSPQAYSSLGEGSHTFYVRAQDAAGNSDTTPASYSWVVDTIAPDSMIDSNPVNPSASNTAAFSFSGSDDSGSGIVGYECRLDTGGFGACTSPQAYSGLGEGSHIFYVRAVDAAGNIDATLATYTWLVDTVAPDNTTITDYPANPTANTAASFSFTGDDGSGSGVAAYQCQLDAGGFGACSSPKEYTSLSSSSHAFLVRAVDAVGNTEASPATYTWLVDTDHPSVSLSSAAADPTHISPIPVTVQFSEIVSGFTADDINLSNATLSNFVAMDGDTYTFDLTPTAQGTLSADIAEGVAQDVSGNENRAAVPFSRVYDSIAPSVIINQTSSQEDPTSSTPIYFTVGFNEPVSEFGTGDVSLGGTAGATTGTVSGSGSTYTVAVSGMTGAGSIIATINADVAQDTAGNGNTASTFTDNTVTFTVDSTTSLTSSANPAVAGQAITFTATLSVASGTPTGTVEFREGANVLSSATLSEGVASFSSASLTPGAHSIIAYYLGSSQHNASTSTVLTQQIDRADTGITIASSATPAGYGNSVTFTATVMVAAPGSGTPTGTVEFFDSSTSLGLGTLNIAGLATISTDELASGTHTINATYSGDSTCNGSATIDDFTQEIEDLPMVTFIDSIADTGDGQLAEDEHTSGNITQLLVHFSKAMKASNPPNANDALNPANYALLQDGTIPLVIDGVSYTGATATLDINGGEPLASGSYTLTVGAAIQDTFDTALGTDFERTFYVDTESPDFLSVITLQSNLPIANGSTLNTSFSSIKITFNEPLNNAGGGTDVKDATYAFNYLLLQTGPDAIYNTKSCLAFADNGNLPVGDDVHIPTASVSYTDNSGAGPYMVTVQLTSGSLLPNGSYRFLVCGTTSVVDLAGNPINGGLDEVFSFSILPSNTITTNPKTGFIPGRVTRLPEQQTAYVDMNELWLEIPDLQVQTDITGVQLTPDGWDVSWLNRQIGWLGGTAYPTWPGNTVLTAHAYTADGLAGPFANLKTLKYGQTIVIHHAGTQYNYAVRDNFTITADNTFWLTRHDDEDWITLITCQQYDEKKHTYRYRQVVRAVLVKVQ